VTISRNQSNFKIPNDATFSTQNGYIIQGDSCEYFKKHIKDESVDLIITSPPFGLVRKKAYGNEDADQFVEWFEQFGKQFNRALKDTGSLVIDIGGAWNPGIPTRSLYHFELLIMLCRKVGFHLAQEFFWWNPAKLPSPAEWVNIRRVRVKDAINCVWWLSKTPYPKVSNRRVLQPYSVSMERLLKNGYKPKLRPSGHDISDNFSCDNGGAIPPNLIAIANTESNGTYQRYCRENGLTEHPARFPAALPAMFIRMLTDKGDVVIDPFGGSCMTGAVSEDLQRKWICCEMNSEYIAGAKGRFLPDAEPLQFKRTKPYEIFPPTFNYIEENLPLVQDGGRTRPIRTNK
jgi:site-specific DNA-methyltransferase (cytosine-N4-specific)